MKALIVPSIEAFRKEPKQYQALKSLLDGVNEGRAALTAGTYAENPQYGRWGTVWVGAHGMRDGLTPPVWGSVAAGYLPGFGAGAAMHGTFEVPESYTGGTLALTLLFMFAVPPTAGDVRTWVVSVSAAHPGGSVTGTTFLVSDYTCRAGDDESLCSVRLPVPDLSFRSGVIVSFQVARSGGATPEPYLLGASWAFQKQRFGLEAMP